MPETQKCWPSNGRSAADVIADLDAARGDDVDWRAGRTNFYVQYGGADVERVAREASNRFLLENGHGGRAFPSLRRFESDLVGWSLDLLGAPKGSGCLTNGGSESILLAMKVARDRARAKRPDLMWPKVVVPFSAHAAFDKAARILGMEVVRIPLQGDYRAELGQLREAICPRTIMLVGSAPQFPHGVFDPIEEMGQLAARAGLWLHVDACVGGYIAPFARELGRPVPAFDLAVPGVSSLSADLHKYGYAPKGVSVVLFSDPTVEADLTFRFEGWPFKPYASALVSGGRAAAPVAAAWAVVRYLGRDGYLRITREVLAMVDRLARGISAIEGLRLVAEPDLSVLAFTSDAVPVPSIAAAMERRGWFVNWGGQPEAIHLGMVTMSQAPSLDAYLSDLAAVVGELRGNVVA